MRNKANIYAEALVQSLKRAPENADAIIAGFHAALKRRGDLKIAGKVIAAAGALLQREAGESADVVFARAPGDALRRTFEQFMNARKLVVREKIDPGLIGGVTITIGNKLLIDASVAGKLKRMKALLS